jgi:tetratricopeptide (TPR) repeat protein
MRARFFLLAIVWCVACAIRATAADALNSRKRPPGFPTASVAQTNEPRASAAVETAVVTNASAESNAVKSAAQNEISQRIDKAYRRIDGGNMQEAIRMFSSVLVQDPVNKRARFGLGTAYIQLQQYKDALAVLEPMAKEFPGDYFLKNNIAWLYATAKDLSIRNGAKAVQFAQEALLIAPKDFHVWSTLSEGYYISGKYDKALRAAEEALKLSLDSPTATDRVEEYQRQVEKSRKAAQAMSIFK